MTIQVGSYANYVGSHFWNFQDELLGLAENPESDQIFKSHSLNMDVLYRSGETQQGALTYTPRVVLVDFQGSLGSVSSRGTLYNEVPETSVENLTWTGSVTNHTHQPVKKNLFLQSLSLEENEKMDCSGDFESKDGVSHSEILDEDIVECLENEVQYWTDFSKVHYHPQSLFELSGLWIGIKDFNNYGIGREVFTQGGHADEINERLRFFVEECDLPQGIQFIVDDSGGFSGIAGEFLENMADEYPNIPVLLYSVRSPDSCLDSKNRKLAMSRKLHDAVSFSKLSAFCKLIVPVGLPSLNTSRMSKYIHLEDQKLFHTSAVYASAIHSVSVPFRMVPLGPSAPFCYTCGAVNVNDVVQLLAGRGRQNLVTALDAALPAPALTGAQLLKRLQSLTPEIDEDVEDGEALEYMTIHGVLGSGSKRAMVSEVQDALHALYSSAAERPRFSHLSVAQCPLPIPLPFPKIFTGLVGQHGELLDTPISDSPLRGSLEVHSIPMAARLRSSTAVLPFLENRLGNLRKFGLARGAAGAVLLKEWGFGDDDTMDMAETLCDMITKLRPISQDSSDSE